MRNVLFPISVAATVITFAGCTTIPPLTLSNTTGPAPSGPKVAALMANLKCELWEAVHDTNTLPVYTDAPSLTPKLFPDAGPDRTFTLKNIFEEIA